MTRTYSIRGHVGEFIGDKIIPWNVFFQGTFRINAVHALFSALWFPIGKRGE